MGVNGVSLANRRMILLAVLSLVASLLTVSFNAPAASAADESIFFTDSTSTVAEDTTGGTHPVEVQLTYTPALLGDVTATVEVDPSSTATEGVDFTISPATVEFLASGSPPTPDFRDVTITLIDEGVYEGDETIVLNLVSPGGGTVGASFG
ncbi:MAG: Calx-beta domain-containing protein, partial [Actinomycetota bacterium]|nr:Calx-beta domain-containing protein [Actinomycetota bacterium]